MNKWYGGDFGFLLLVCISCIYLAHNEFVNDRLFECGMFGFTAILSGVAMVMEWINEGNKKL